VSDLIGKKLKDFYVLRRLGRGAMAEVYLAQQLSLSRQVALKILNSELARDPNYVRRFHHEARAAAALVHGGIVQIYEVGGEHGVHFIAQEYVAGRNLGEVIRSRGSLDPPLTLDILRQVAAALAKASSQGIVHRDIKPENIMLARTGEVKVADFGLARVQGEPGVDLTQVGVTMGTPLYMSPEQIEGRELDSRSDIYSLGVTAHHMLRGEPPFHGDSPLAVAVQHLNQPPPPLNPSGLGAPSPLMRLAPIIERMMAKKPADRYSDPASLLAELNSLAAAGATEGWAKGSNGAVVGEMLQLADERDAATNHLSELMTSLGVPQQRWPNRWIALALAGCLALGGVVAVATRPEPILADAYAGLPRSNSVWEQIYHAKIVDTEEAWHAVEQYFPSAEAYYRNLAKQGLAYYYLTRSGEFQKSLKLLQQLADSSQRTLQAFGIAGLVVAHTELNEDQQAYDYNQQLSTEMRAKLEVEAPRMSAMLNDALDKLAARAF
jgi:eukaryotic-like serine/threonine-protein kinase